MLYSLHVKNLALIDEVEIYFKEGLNILTGETGAGKSIIIDCMSLALGAKFNRDMATADNAFVELAFEIREDSLKEKLKELEVECEDDMIFLARRIVNGKALARINSENVPLFKLRQVAELLIDIHGQHETSSLLSEKNHIDVLDRYIGEAAVKVKDELASAYRDYKNAVRALEELDVSDGDRKREADLLEYQISEIEACDIKQGEIEELDGLYSRMNNSKKFRECCGFVDSMLFSGNASVSDAIDASLKELNSNFGEDESIDGLLSQLNDIDSLMGDFKRSLTDAMDGLDFSEEEFYSTERRLDEVNRISDKYGPGYEEVSKTLDELKEKLDVLENYDRKLEEAKRLKEEAYEKLIEICDKLAKIRKEAAARFEKELSEQLEGLNFNDIKFEVRMDKHKEPTSNGMDEVAFYISTNPGVPIGPLAKIASGGELSRIMLGIKTLLSGKDEIGTLIFDEIDAGISGRTAHMVAKKLEMIARSNQLICITHLPQIAAKADTHYMIEKSVDGQKTRVDVRELDYDASIEELSRLLAGDEITQAVRENAIELKKRTEND